MTTSSPIRRLGRHALLGVAVAAGVATTLVTATPAVAAPDPTTAPAHGASPYLLTDAAPGTDDGLSLDNWPTSVVVGGRALYAGSDGRHGVELWSTDGTRGGTRMLKDLAPGTVGSEPQQLVVMGGKAYFSARVAGNRELWVSDGSPSGTHRVVDLGGPAVDAEPFGFTAAHGRLWFTAVTTSGGQEVGREPVVSDGTAAGTHLVEDVKPGPLGSDAGSFVRLAGGRVAFQATATGGNREVWVSDGTADGTQVVRDLNGTPAASVDDGDLVALPSGTAVFRGNDGSGWRLWRSDGTTAGTVLVDSNPWALVEPFGLYVVGNRVYFAATTIGAGQELFSSDGTAAGTGVVADLVPGPGSSSVRPIRAAGGSLWFQASTVEGRHELWSVRPGAAPRMRRVLATGGQGYFYFESFSVVNGQVFFSADISPYEGHELYRVDAGGVRLVQDRIGTTPAHPFALVGLRATLLFAASSANRGREVFAYNTQPTTTRLRAFRRYSAGQAARRSIRVRVTVRGGSLAQTGRVVVRDGRRVVGAGRVVRGAGTVRITRVLAPGRHRLTARYAGSTAGRASTSAVVRVVVLRAG